MTVPRYITAAHNRGFVKEWVKCYLSATNNKQKRNKRES